MNNALVKGALTHWQTSLVGIALLILAGASALGVPLPIVGGVQLSTSELTAAGLSALGFFVAKDSNKA